MNNGEQEVQRSSGGAESEVALLLQTHTHTHTLTQALRLVLQALPVYSPSGTMASCVPPAGEFHSYASCSPFLRDSFIQGLVYIAVVADDTHAHIFLLLFLFFFFPSLKHQIGMLIISLRFLRDLPCFSCTRRGRSRAGEPS